MRTCCATRRVESLPRHSWADVEIRADANRAWSLEDAILFGKELGSRDVNLQFIEEPEIRKDLEEFFFNTNVFYALDETVDAFIKTQSTSLGDNSSFYKASSKSVGMCCDCFETIHNWWC